MKFLRASYVPLSFARLRQGIPLQVRIITALMVRDLMVRYGRQNIGFLWVIIEPMILTIGVMVIWSLIKSPHEHGVPLVALVFTGYMPLTLWRHLCAIGVNFFKLRVGLFYHQRVTLIDAIIARLALEFIGTSAAFVVVYLALIAADVIEPIVDVTPVVVGWILLGFLSCGVAVLVAVLTEAFEVFEHFYQPFQYFMLPVCGAFFMVEWLPSVAAHLAWYVPTVHCFELIRQGFFGGYIETHYSIWYVALWSLVTLAVGFPLIESIRDRLHL